MEGKAVFVLVATAILAAPVRADEAALKLTFKPGDGANGEKTVFIARERGEDGKVRAETRLEVTAKKDGAALEILAEEPEKENPKAKETSKDVDEAHAQADEAGREAGRAVQHANRELHRARRQLDAAKIQLDAAKIQLEEGLLEVGIRIGCARLYEREPQTVHELLGIDEGRIVVRSATRRDVTVEVGSRSISCSLHEFQVKEGEKTRSVRVWLSADAKGSGIVALQVTAEGTTREMALEGFVATPRTATPAPEPAPGTERSVKVENGTDRSVKVESGANGNRIELRGSSGHKLEVLQRR